MVEITWQIENDFIAQFVDGIETIRIENWGEISLKGGMTIFHKCVIMTGDPSNPTKWGTLSLSHDLKENE